MKNTLILFKKINKIWSHICDNIKFKVIEEKIDASPIINSNQFLDSSICYYIKKTQFKNTKYVIRIDFNGKRYSMLLSIFSCRKHNIKLLAKICMVLPLLFENNRPINIMLIMCPHKKQLPTKKMTCLSSKHVNSGLSYDNKIIIYREEEHEKLLIHELIHVLSLDSKFTSGNFIKNEINVSSRTVLNPNEGFTEFWANIIYTMIWCINNKQDLETCIKHDQTFSCLQVAKILNHFNYSSAEELLLKKHLSKKSNFSQNTSAFSYYILKACLLHNFDEWCIPNKTNCFTIDSNCKRKILTQLRDKIFLKRINGAYFVLKNNNSKLLDKTMRMTYHG